MDIFKKISFFLKNNFINLSYVMDIIIIMILFSIFLSISFLSLFLIGIYYGQFDDYESPKFRILSSKEKKRKLNQANDEDKKLL